MAYASVAIYGISGDGDGIGLLDGRKIFVRGALPGETARVELKKSRNSYLLGVAAEIAAPSEMRLRPICDVYGRCGGCSMQHMPYAMELECTRMKVADALKRIGGIDAARVFPVEPYAACSADVGEGDMPAGGAADGAGNMLAGGAWQASAPALAPRYRNNAQYAVGRAPGSAQRAAGRAPGSALAIGYFEPGSHAIVGISDCALQKRNNAEVLKTVREWALAPGHGGSAISDVVVRTGERTGDVMVMLVSRTPEIPGVDDLARRLAGAVSGLKSVIVNINPSGRDRLDALDGNDESDGNDGRDALNGSDGQERSPEQIWGCAPELSPELAPELSREQVPERSPEWAPEQNHERASERIQGRRRGRGRRPRLGGECVTVWGDGYIYERICECSFRLSPTSIFQVNTGMAERAYGKMLSLAELAGTEAVLDLYCGTGSISISMARRAREVVGIEASEDAVRDARFNAGLNGA
ncbi:MAG: TRAM domain-containing protein, partial [Clostridiales bacterium]|nr:TRAM domain-containing protein [Clostridiales bacterium]